MIDIPGFSEFDISAIKNMMLKRPPSYIASTLGKDIINVRSAISQIALAGNLTPYKEKMRTVAPVKVKVLKRDKNEEKRAALNYQQSLDNKRRSTSRHPQFKTKQVDYSALRSLRIDAKTVIYIKHDESPEQARDAFLLKYKKV